jgi:transposase InsO family protein
MSLKLKFVEQARAPGATIAALCREYGISRQTGHKWLRRYRDDGPLGLVEQSRRPRSSPLSKAEDIVAAIVELRDRHLTWGPDKIARVLAVKFGRESPSKSTVARVLKRLGKVRRRRPVARLWTVDEREHVEVRAPNELWTIDFKGWWKAGNGQLCEPLTVRDAYSRYVLAAKLVGDKTRRTVKYVLQQLFKEHGVPLAIQCDNGSPWVSLQARGGLTRLSAWLISLGIRLIRSRPGCPQDNGGHERMHRDLRELQLRPARSRASQQLECDRWVVEFNHVRPHAALGGKTPAEVYRVTERRPIALALPNYPPEWRTRRVATTGAISFEGDHIFISIALAGKLIGLRYEGGLRWRAYFFGVDLGTIEVASLNGVVSTVTVSGVNGSVNPQRAAHDDALVSAGT